jgi:hypothetical protein
MVKITHENAITLSVLVLTPPYAIFTLGGITMGTITRYLFFSYLEIFKLCPSEAKIEFTFLKKCWVLLGKLLSR